MELGGLSPSAGDLGGRVPLRKCLVYKEHIDRDKIALNAVEIQTVQDYMHQKLILIFKPRVKQITYESNI